MNDYETYLTLSRGNTLDVIEAANILKAMNVCVASIKASDKMDFYNDCLRSAFKYAGIRTEWELISQDDKLKNDFYRSSCHDGFITSLNILQRLAASEGIDTTWRSDLGEDRKRIGDFACYIAYINAISNR